MEMWGMRAKVVNVCLRDKKKMKPVKREKHSPQEEGDPHRKELRSLSIWRTSQDQGPVGT